MPKMVCVKCEVALRPKKNGVYVQEMYMENKKTYKIWCADLWKCPICRAEIVSGFGSEPKMFAFQGDADAEIERLKQLGRIVIKDQELKYLDVKWEDE